MDINDRCKFRWFFLQIILILICLSGCRKSNHYVAFYTKDVFGKNIVVEINDHAETITKTFQLQGDVTYNTYDFLEKEVFIFGPGGLINVDIDKNEIDLISNKNISHVFKTDNSYGYVENTGLKDGKYKSMIIPSLDEKDSFELEYAVNSIIYKDNFLYISNLPIYDTDKIYIDKFTMKGDFVKREYCKNFGRIIEIKGELAYLSVDSIATKQNVIDLKKPLFSIYEEVEVIDNEIHQFEFNTDNMTCSFDGDVVFNDCLGFIKYQKNKYLVNNDDKYYIFDCTTLKKELYETKKYGEVYFLTIFPF